MVLYGMTGRGANWNDVEAEEPCLRRQRWVIVLSGVGKVTLGLKMLIVHRSRMNSFLLDPEQKLVCS